MGFSQLRDPRLNELMTHVKILEAKLNSNLTAVDDFRELMIETRKELQPSAHTSIATVIGQVEEALLEAKKVLELVCNKKNNTKVLVE